MNPRRKADKPHPEVETATGSRPIETPRSKVEDSLRMKASPTLESEIEEEQSEFDLLTPHRAGMVAKNSAQTLRYWGDRNIIPVIKTTTGERLFLRKDVVRVAKERHEAQAKRKKRKKPEW